MEPRQSRILAKLMHNIDISFLVSTSRRFEARQTIWKSAISAINRVCCISIYVNRFLVRKLGF